LVFKGFWNAEVCSRSSLFFPFLPFCPSPFHRLPSLPSLSSLSSWRMAGRSAPAPSAPPPAAARCRGRRGLPTRRGYRIWSLGSTELSVPSKRLAKPPIHFICQLWLRTHLRCQPWLHLPLFTSLCQPWLHSHFTLPTLASLSLHFANLGFTLTSYVGKSPPRPGVSRCLTAERGNKHSNCSVAM